MSVLRNFSCQLVFYAFVLLLSFDTQAEIPPINIQCPCEIERINQTKAKVSLAIAFQKEVIDSGDLSIRLHGATKINSANSSYYLLGDLSLKSIPYSLSPIDLVVEVPLNFRPEVELFMSLVLNSGDNFVDQVNFLEEASPYFNPGGSAPDVTSNLIFNSDVSFAYNSSTFTLDIPSVSSTDLKSESETLNLEIRMYNESNTRYYVPAAVEYQVTYDLDGNTSFSVSGNLDYSIDNTFQNNPDFPNLVLNIARNDTRIMRYALDVLGNGELADLAQTWTNIDTLLDSDGDGVSDFNERILGTNSLIPNEVPKSVIEIAFTAGSNAEASYLGGSNLGATITHHIAVANAAFKDSGLAIELKEVGIYSVGDDSDLDADAVLAAMKARDGIFTDLDELLERQPDLFMHYSTVDVINTGGKASVLGSRNDGIIDYKTRYLDGSNRGVVSIGNVSITLGHEVGHLLGLTHSRKQNTAVSTGTFPWSLGHGIDNNFSTVMAYASEFNASGLGIFSSPNLSCGEAQQPCGIERFDQFNGADAVRSLQTTAYQVSAISNGVAPVLTLLGNNPEYISNIEMASELKAQASDREDGDITDSISSELIAITISDISDDEYEQIYMVTDSERNTSKISRRVIVVNEDMDTDADADADGITDSNDNCVNEANSDQLDTDGDNIGDACDLDDDGDGVLDSQDAFPLDVTESIDSDLDGIGDNADTDDDNDSVLDGDDAFPLNASESVDTDGDGIGNNADTDDDGDGVPDLQDAFPLKNTETTDSDGDGIGDNDEERAQLVASDILSQKMISYAGSVAAAFVQEIEDAYAGESDSWTLARGTSVSLSVACTNGGGYDAVVTRTDWQVLTISLDIENCVDLNLMTTNGSATLTYDDALWDQQTPREQHPFIFSFSNLSIQDRVSKRFNYTGSLYCDSHYNSAAESWTFSDEGNSLVYEGRWGSVFDDLGEVYWNVNSSLLIDESGNTDFYIARYVTNCDFLNIQVKEGTKNHTILDVQYISEYNGSGYKISEDTRSEKLEKVENKEVFLKERYTPETGWTTELYSRYGRNSSVRLSGKGDYSVNVYSSIIPTYYWARREGIDNIISQEVDQFSNFEWVYLDETTDTIFSVNSERDWYSVWDFENDGIEEVISEPWAISRFYSATECNRFLRFGEWTVVAQSPKSESPPPCNFNTGFDIYDGEIWYQDTNLDGLNELFTLDDDGDGVTDAEDNCQAVVNSSQIDTDNDSVGNACDKDDDGDGTPDSSDAFPLDNSETLDTDGDGVGNNSDWAPYDFDESADSDGDGVGDNADAFPNDPTEILDMDSDGIGDNSDSDIDGDGTLNSDDPYPLNGEYSADSDNDGMPDEWETKYGLDPNDPSDATSDQDNDGVTALDEFLAGTIPSGSLDIDGNEDYDALTDGLLLLRGMFGLDGSALVTGTIASDAAYTDSVDIESRIETLGDLADIDGNGDIDALTDGLLTLRYLFGLQGDTLINGVVAEDATRKTAEEIEAHLETLMPSL